MIIFKLLIFIISFSAIAILFYNLFPYLAKIIQRWQEKRRQKFAPAVDRMLVDVPLKRIVLIDYLSPLGTAGFAWFLTHNLGFALLGGIAGLTVSSFLIKQMEAFRRKRFADQLVDALLLLSSSLKAGLSLMQAFEVLVEQMPAPVSQEFSILVRQSKMGIPLEETLHKMQQRMQCEDLDAVATAILVSYETGGDVTTLISQLISSIRERNKLHRRVRVLCTQGRLQGKIMSVLPILFGFIVFKLDPHFFNVLLNEPQGRLILGYAIVSVVVGIFLINRLSRIEV